MAPIRLLPDYTGNFNKGTVVCYVVKDSLPGKMGEKQGKKKKKKVKKKTEKFQALPVGTAPPTYDSTTPFSYST